MHGFTSLFPLNPLAGASNPTSCGPAVWAFGRGWAAHSSAPRPACICVPHGSCRALRCPTHGIWAKTFKLHAGPVCKFKGARTGVVQPCGTQAPRLCVPQLFAAAAAFVGHAIATLGTHRPQHLGPWHAWPCKWAMQRTQWPRPCAAGHTCAAGHLWATAWLGGTQVGAPSGPCGPVACGRVLQHPGSSWGANQLLQHMLQHLASAVGCCSMGVLLQGLCSMVLGLRCAPSITAPMPPWLRWPLRSSARFGVGRWGSPAGSAKAEGAHRQSCWTHLNN